MPIPTRQDRQEPTLGRRAGWALFWNIAFLPLKALLTLVVALVIVRLFPRDIYVALAAITALQTTLGLFVDLGIERALPRFVGQVERQLGRGALRRFLTIITLLKMAALAFFICLVAVWSGPIIEWFNLGQSGRVYLALVAAMLVLGALYDICTQVLYSFFKQKVTNLLDIVVTVLNPLLTLALIVWPFQLEVYGVMLALLATTVISVLIAGWQAVRAAGEAAEIVRREREPSGVAASDNLPVDEADGQSGVEQSPARRLWVRFARYAALMYFFTISTWFYEAAFAILVFSFYQEFLTVALIRLSYSFIKQMLKTLLTPLQGVQTPLFAALHAEDRHDRLQAAYSSISKLQIFILVPSALGLMLLSRNLVELLFASSQPGAALSFNDLELAAWATALTVLVTFAESLISLPMLVLQVYERYRLVILSRTLPLLGGGLLVLAAFLRLNALVAILIMGSMAVGSRLFALLAVRRTLGLRYPVAFLWKVLKSALAFVVPLSPVALLLPVSWPATLLTAVLGIMIFLMAFRRQGGFDQAEKARLLSMKLPFRKFLLRWL